jgi:hypothetical protein
MPSTPTGYAVIHLILMCIRREWTVSLASLATLWGFYLLMFLSYRAYDIDNPWFLSFSHNACREHIQNDQFLGVKFPNGMDGTQLFGKIAAGIQCAALTPFGWQQRPAAVLASTLIVLALGMWWLQLRKIGYSERFTFLFVLALGLSEPVLAAANRFRYEEISFFMISLGLLLVTYDLPFCGVVVGALALEVQPAAIAGVIPIAYLAWRMRSSRGVILLKFIAGLLVAACAYLLLHPNVLTSKKYFDQVRGNDTTFLGGYFSAYFLHRVRHLPELALFAVAAIFYWSRRRSITDHYLAVSAGVILMLAIFMPHGNAAYMIFLYPFLVGMTLVGLQAERMQGLSFALIALLFLPQYVVTTFLNWGYGYRPSDIAGVSAAISESAREIGQDEKNMAIYGDYSLWFAHPDRYRAAAVNTIPEIQNADLYLCYENAVEPAYFIARETLHCSDIRRYVPLRLVRTIPVRGKMLSIYSRLTYGRD